tara:strand:- start:683 stop:1483 length:801 start_codon:yes stop_codon:yes gene_type:complete
MSIFEDTFLVGDSQEVLKEVDDGIVHFTCTSPPYYNARAYSTWPTYDEYLEFLHNVFTEVYRVTADGRMCAVNLSPVIQARESRAHESKRLAIPFHFFSIMERMGWKYIDDIVWVKPEGAAINRNGGFYQHRKPVAYKPNIVSEVILIFQKPGNFLIDKILKSQKDEIIEKSKVADGYERSNVWNIHPETNSDHPAPYPKELSDKLIQYYSFVDDLVLDPFMGSGTTAISSKDCNRHFLGIELHEEYVEKSINRLKKFQPLSNFLT